MRRSRGNRFGIALAAVATSVAAFSIARTSRAEGVCDPEGHFCIHIDTTSASVCDLLRPGDLDPDACSVQDEHRRDLARKHSPRPLRALTIRFDDWWVFANVQRIDAHGEIGPDQVAEQGRLLRASIEKQADSVGEFAAPTVRRIHDVQTLWFDTVGTWSGHRTEQIDVEVRAADATYDVSLHGPPGSRLHAFAEATLATLDALPATSSQGAGDAIKWIVRGLVMAVILAVLAWWFDSRKKGRAMDPRDLWPR